MGHKQTIKTKDDPISSLLLIGGKSRRMGSNKAFINFHGKPQWEFLQELFAKRCDASFLSLQEVLPEFTDSNYVLDDGKGLGPMAGLLASFEKNSNTAWLLSAVDMPNINDSAVQYLLDNRASNKIATAFINRETADPDPLFTVYEKDAFPLLKEQFKDGNYSLRYFLQRNAIQLLECPNPNLLTNVNSPEELREYRAKKAAI
ncbi:molybdenum cofactor guanylyltransferase [Chitinophagales bacterium]|nr:molybdenum cofactor guanylyltransferase [Chitinophagales bacterium]